MARKEITTLWDRQNRNDINSNFKELYDEYTEAGATAKEAKRVADIALEVASQNNGYLEDNQGSDFPLKSVTFNGVKEPVGEQSRQAILDAKVFGAKPDCYYKILYLANGREARGKLRWGVTIAEYDKDTFSETDRNYRWLFIYSDDEMPGNEGNANWQKGEEGIDTITIDNGEIAVSVTVDRDFIENEGAFPTHITVSQDSPTAIIDPSNYFF